MAHYRQRSWAQTVNPSGGGGSTPTFGTVQWTPGSDSGLKPAIAVQSTFTALALSRNQTIGVQTLMPSLALANNRSIAVQTTGSVLGAPFWQSVGTFDSADGTASVVIPKPAGLAVGDLMLAFLGGVQGFVATSAGWTNLRRSEAVGVGVLGAVLESLYKVATAADVAASNFTFGVVISNGCWGCIHRIAGVNATPINVDAGGSGSAANPICPTVTTTANNCLIFLAATQANVLAVNYTPPAGHLERTDQEGNITLGTVHINDGTTDTRVLATAGATGAQTITNSTIVASNYATQTVAIAPGEIFF